MYRFQMMYRSRPRSLPEVPVLRHSLMRYWIISSKVTPLGQGPVESMSRACTSFLESESLPRKALESSSGVWSDEDEWLMSPIVPSAPLSRLGLRALNSLRNLSRQGRTIHSDIDSPPLGFIIAPNGPEMGTERAARSTLSGPHRPMHGSGRPGHPRGLSGRLGVFFLFIFRQGADCRFC